MIPRTLSKTEETPLSQRIEIDILSLLDLGMRMDISGDSADKF